MLFWSRSAKNISTSENEDFVDRYSYLMRKINSLEEKCVSADNETCDTIKKLERIVKYARDDKPTFNTVMRTEYRGSYAIVVDKFCDLYLYVDKEEYKINLTEITKTKLTNEDCSLEIKNNLAYFTVNTKEEDSDKRYEFIIDYKNGKYILIEEIDMRKPSKMRGEK